MPPRDEAGVEQLWKAIRDLEPYQPTFVSVTYGAGGIESRHDRADDRTDRHADIAPGSPT